jgi:hypothetical protein
MVDQPQQRLTPLGWQRTATLLGWWRVVNLLGLVPAILT